MGALGSDNTSSPKRSNVVAFQPGLGNVRSHDVDFLKHWPNDQNVTSDGDQVMSTVSREEIQALLAANKAEMESIASSIRAEMALSRENTNVQLASITSALNSISSKIDGKMDSVDGDVKSINGKFDGIQGQITGINTAISGIQSGISTRLAIFGVIIAVVVALPSLISALKDNPPTTQQPIIITPQQSPVSVHQPTSPSHDKSNAKE